MSQTKLKRGVSRFTHAELGECWFNNTRPDGMIVVCSSNEFKITDTYTAVEKESLSEVLKIRSGLSLAPKTLSEKKKTEKHLLNEFFDSLILKLPYLCDECARPLFAFNKFAKRSCCSHIFPKHEFPELATNELNIFYLAAEFLGGCNHHDSWDRLGAEHRKTMNVYKIALERLELLKPFMKNEHQIIRAYTYLGLEVK